MASISGESSVFSFGNHFLWDGRRLSIVYVHKNNVETSRTILRGPQSDKTALRSRNLHISWKSRVWGQAIIARSALYVRTPQNRTPKSCSLLLLRKIITFHRVGNDAANRLSAPRWIFGWFTKIRLKLQLRVSIARSRNPFFATFCVFLFKKRFCTF